MYKDDFKRHRRKTICKMIIYIVLVVCIAAMLIFGIWHTIAKSIDEAFTSYDNATIKSIKVIPGTFGSKLDVLFVDDEGLVQSVKVSMSRVEASSENHADVAYYKDEPATADIYLTEEFYKQVSGQSSTDWINVEGELIVQ